MPKRILCVEDDPDFRWAITETLYYAGYEVIEAENGLTGLVVASTSLPACDNCMFKPFEREYLERVIGRFLD